MKKSLWILGAALCTLSFAACSDDEGTQAAVGITAGTVIPEGSAVAYDFVVNGTYLENTNDSVDWMVTDDALRHAVVKVTPTMGCTASYNGTAIPGEGLVIDVTSPVTIQVSGAGTTVAYTLNVVRATTASGDDMRLVASSFMGMPSPLYDVDVTYFNGSFYAIATTVTGNAEAKMENHQLFSSEDGVNWTEVNYQTSNSGVVLPDGQTGWSVGGEGASLVVFNDRLYVLGGARTQAADRFGEAAEVSSGWFGPGPALNAWRSASTADGVTFEADTIGATYTNSEGNLVALSQLGTAYATPVVFNGALYLKAGYAPAMTMWQSKSLYVRTHDGKNWEDVSVVSASGDDCNVGTRCGAAFFAFKGKLWCVGGYRPMFPGTSTVDASIWSSADGETWTLEDDGTNAKAVMGNMYGMKVAANDDVAYMFGGMVLDENGSSTLSDKIFRSTDGVNWEEVETHENYAGSFIPSIVLQGNAAWVFGGKTGVEGSYSVPAGVEVATETWVKLMN